MKLKTIQDIPELKGKKVFVRVGFDVPLDQEGQITDDKRIRNALPTINYLLEKGAEQIILAAHMGRPKNNEDHLKSNAQAKRLSELLGQPVAKVDEWGESGLPDTQVVMLENVRFHPAEKSKDEAERDAFGKQMASLADLYVNEAFSNSHREQASMTSIPKFIPGYLGLGIQEQVEGISKAIESPQHPLVAIIGGLKADKLMAIKNLLPIADKILVAGALSCNLYKSKGYEMGNSKIDNEGMEEKADIAQVINDSAKVELPMDFVVADAFSESAEVKTVAADQVEPGWMALDIGPKTIERFVSQITEAKTVLWFGPIGVFEMKPFANGTQKIGSAIAQLEGTKIIGGGDSANAVKKLGLEDQMTLVSTGGGASLQMIEGKVLPALNVLQRTHTQ